MCQLVIGGTSKAIWISSIYALPIVIIGLFLGQILFKKLNQKLFTKMIYVLLLFTGVFLLSQSILNM
jgi:uncharacterized membrane protein YfcA